MRGLLSKVVLETVPGQLEQVCDLSTHPAGLVGDPSSPSSSPSESYHRTPLCALFSKMSGQSEIISYLKKTISMNEKDQEKQTEKLTLAEN